MAKNKRLSEKLRQYYKGAAKRPAKVASDEEMKIISEALSECLPKRFTHTFECLWNNEELDLKLVVGLSAGLRLLRREKAKGMLLCSTSAVHLTNILTTFTSKRDVPLIIADRLVNLASSFGMKTLLLITLADNDSSLDAGFYKKGDPLPKQLDASANSDSLNRLVQLLTHGGLGQDDRYKFKSPVTIRVKSTGKSQTKKSIKRQIKMERAMQEKVSD